MSVTVNCLKLVKDGNRIKVPVTVIYVKWRIKIYWVCNHGVEVIPASNGRVRDVCEC